MLKEGVELAKNMTAYKQLVVVAVGPVEEPARNSNRRAVVVERDKEQDNLRQRIHKELSKICSPQSSSNQKRYCATSVHTSSPSNFAKWSLMATNGANWIATAKDARLLRRCGVKWTLVYRKLRRCKIVEDKQEREVTESLSASNRCFGSCSVKWGENERENLPSRINCHSGFCPQASTRTTGDTSRATDLFAGQISPERISKTINTTSEQSASKSVASSCFEMQQVTRTTRPTNRPHGPLFSTALMMLLLMCCLNSERSFLSGGSKMRVTLVADASLIVGDSAIEIQEIDNPETADHHRQQEPIRPTTQWQPNEEQHEQPSIILGSTSGATRSLDPSPVTISGPHNTRMVEASDSSGGPPESVPMVENFSRESRPASDGHQRQSQMPAPLPPLVSSQGGDSGNNGGDDDVTDGDGKSRGSHDYLINEPSSHKDEEQNSPMSSTRPGQQVMAGEDKAIAGKVVDFELTPAGGHNKAKIKKKKKKKEENEMFKKWEKKKKAEKKASEHKHKEGMKKKKEEGKKNKKKWGHEEHGLKKKGKFKKKKWGHKVKKGKGVKKGKKGKKFLKDKGHKNTGFKTVYHKEEWGKSSKWHDIKREKKWDEKAKKWKKKWKKEKGKKYKGNHMKKFEKKKKEGKKYKKEKKDKFKKFKKEKHESGKKKKMEEFSKKKGGGKKKKEMKKKKKEGGR